MYKNLRQLRAAFVVLLAFTAQAGQPVASVSVSASSPSAKPAPLKIGFVYVSPIGDSGWTYQHNLGRLAVEKHFGSQVQTTVVESVSEGPDAERVLRDLAAQGNQLIFATSFGYLEPALKVAHDYPGVKFEHAGGYKSAPNLQTYNARYYEGRYLAGLVAGASSKSGVAGYVAGFPVPEVIQGINAFTRGMRVVNPKAQVKVVWLSTWFDPAREREAALSLVHDGADVLTNHSGSPAVARAAQESGVKLVAYQSDMRAVAPKAQLTAIVHQWGSFYVSAAQAVRDGRWTPTPVWGGLKDGFIALAPLSDDVSAATRAQVARAQADIVAGQLHPFAGRITDREGRVRLPDGVMPDADIARMNYFVPGVVGSLPESR